MSIGVIVFGEVGSGKSTLCNIIISKKNAFAENDMLMLRHLKL